MKLNTLTTPLKWDCDGIQGSGTVFCSTKVLGDFSCMFGALQDLRVQCDCTDLVKMSEITFLTPSAGGNATVYCSDGREQRAISVVIPGICTLC